MNEKRLRKREPIYKKGSRVTTIISYPGFEEERYVLKQIDWLKSSEEMVDTVGFLQNDSNPCYHVRFTGALAPVPAFAWGPGPPYATFRLEDDGFIPVSFSADGFPVSLPAQWLDDFSASAEHHFKTAVDETHSIINILLELVEMCEGNIQKIGDFAKKFAKAMATFNKIYQRTGKFWLAWNFALKPLLGDIRAIIDSLKRAKKRLKWLREHNHIDTKVKYREGPRIWTDTVTLAVAYPSTPGPGVDPLWPPFEQVHFDFDLEIEATLSAHAWVRFDIPDHILADDDLGLATVWSALAGLYNPLKVAWEAIPFSWLIDWFVSLRTRLQLEAASLSPLKDAEILTTCWSVKYNVRATGNLHVIDPPQVYGAGNALVRGYIRQPGLPEVGYPPFQLPFAWYNASILTALVQSKHRRG